MKIVTQLDADGYFVGTTVADASPLEAGVYLMPARTIEADAPTVPDGQRAKWDNGWVFEAIPAPEVDETPEYVDPLEPWARNRVEEYPPPDDYLDGIVKGDQAQIDKYIADCLAVKAKYPKP
jgi:hypothetical protein